MIKSYFRRLVLVFVLTITSIGVGVVVTQQGGRIPLHPEQVAATSGIFDFTWSPDGKYIAYVSSQSGNSEIWIVPSTGGTARRLTSTPLVKKEPRWSRDGKWIAFVALQSGAGDIFIVNVADETTINLTESAADERHPAWSPDSREIAFSERFTNGARTAVVNQETRNIRPLSGTAASDIAWSPDGKSILYVANPLLTNDDRRENLDVFLIPSEGGVPRLLTPGTPRFRDFDPSWAPDSRHVVYASDSSGFSNILILDTQDNTRKNFATGETDHFQPHWSPDSDNIAYVRNDAGHLGVWTNSTQVSHAVKVSDREGINGGYTAQEAGPTGKIEWSPDGKRLAFTHSDPARTSDIWVANLDGTRSLQLTNSMPQELRREARFVTPDPMTYKSFDGEEIFAFVYKPRGVKPKAGHPSILIFRDALDGQHTFDWDPVAQFFVSDGYLVFAPNVRGSNGRGREFRQLAFQRGGDDDVRDAFIGLDRLSSEGLVDVQRVGVFGAGTGGFLATSALIRDEARFRAAVCLYGVVDAVTAASNPGMRGWTRFMIGESPMTSPFPFYERSLINFVDKLRTPIIFFYTGDGPNPSIQQLQQFAVQAEVKAKWFDYRIFDNESEGWQYWRPISMRQTLEAMDALFEKHLLGRDREIRLSREH